MIKKDMIKKAAIFVVPVLAALATTMPAAAWWGGWGWSGLGWGGPCHPLPDIRRSMAPGSQLMLSH